MVNTNRKNGKNPDKKRIIQIRLSERDPVQDKLWNDLEADRLQHVNISAVTRLLWLRWYEYRQATGNMDVPALGGVLLAGNGNGHGLQEDVEEEQDDWLASGLATLNPMADKRLKAHQEGESL